MITSRPLKLLMAITIAVGAGATARAQSPCNFSEQQLSSATPDAAAMRACVEANAAGLKGDFDAIRMARQQLLLPLRASNVSVHFRLTYADALLPVIRPLCKDPNDDIAINALRLAGELGTSDGARLCIDALADKRPGVRMMAASGLARTCAIIAGTETIQADQFARIEGEVAKALVKERNPEVLDGYAMVYEAAVQIGADKIPTARSTALRNGASKFGELVRSKEMSPEAETAMLRASKAMFDSLTQAIDQPKPTKEALIEVGGFGGDLLAYSLRRINAGDVSDEDRAQLSVLVGQAQNLVARSYTELMPPNTPVKSYQLDRHIREKNDQQFKRDVMMVIGSEGDLTKQPFDHKKERFLPTP